MCPKHRITLHSTGGAREFLRCERCKGRGGRWRKIKLFLLRNIVTGAEIACPVDDDKGIKE